MAPIQADGTYSNKGLMNHGKSLDFSDKVYKITTDISTLLIDKNKKYGDSALRPIRIFSNANAIEQLLVRIDDKLSRISANSSTEDEDVITDLIGYLILLRIAKEDNA
jgi:hypothetical protein